MASSEANPAGRGTGNSRNGNSDKTVLTGDGEVNLHHPTVVLADPMFCCCRP